MLEENKQFIIERVLSTRHVRRSLGSGGGGGDASSVLSSGGRTQKSSGSSKLSHGATARDSGGSSGHCTHRSEPPPRLQVFPSPVDHFFIIFVRRNSSTLTTRSYIGRIIGLTYVETAAPRLNIRLNIRPIKIVRERAVTPVQLHHLPS